MTVDYVTKRFGGKEKFDKTKIFNALWRAVESVGGEDKEKCVSITNNIVEKINETYNESINIEQIQDIVEETLIKGGYDKVAKSYILYRHQHSTLRSVKDIFSDTEVIDNYIDKKDWRVKENANSAYSLQGLNFHIGQKLIANYWLSKIYSPEIAKLHYDGDLHIHDLGSLSAYCMGHDLKQLLLQGFNGVSGKIESGPPKHFRTALGQVVNFLFTMQGESAGAQAFSNFDTYLAPFIRHDKLNRAQVKQAIQEFMYNMNVSTRVGFQTVFSNITLDIHCPEHIKNQPIIIGGKLQDVHYGDFQEEMNLLNEVLSETYLEGDFKGRPFTFPIPTYNITKDFDWDNKTLDNVWKMTAKIGVPYFANYVYGNIKPSDAISMCCRLRLDTKELNTRGGGLFASHPLTGSIGVVTINLPRIGYTSSTEKEFFDRLTTLLDAGKKSLITKRKILEKYTDQGLYPYTKVYLKAIKDNTGNYWTNHFSTIGIVGMNECCLNFLKTDISSDEGLKFAIKVSNFIRDKLKEYQLETDSIFNYEAVPAEGVTRRFANNDKTKFPDIIVGNESNYKKGVSPYYSNSTQLPVDFEKSLFDVLRHQEQLQTLYTGGTVLHIYVGEEAPDKESIKNLLRKITSQYALPYLSFTPTFSVCPLHGLINGKHEYCPICEAEN